MRFRAAYDIFLVAPLEDRQDRAERFFDDEP
jgi:hypothetical protein